MDWMKIYCLAWLVISAMFALEAAATFNLDDLAHQRKGDNPKDFFDSYDDEEEAEMAFSLSNRLPELYDDLNEALGFMSVDAMQNSMLGLSCFLLLLDAAGFLLAYQNIHRSELHLIIIAIIGVLYLISSVEFLLMMYKLIGAFRHPRLTYELLARYVDIYGLSHLLLPTFLSRLATMGKFLVALYLFLTVYKLH